MPAVDRTSPDLLLHLLQVLSEEAPDEDLDRLVEDAERTADPEQRERLLLALTRAVRVREVLAHHRRREQETQALFETARDLASLRDTDDVLAAIVQRVGQLFHPDATYLALVDEHTGEAYMRVTSGTVTSAIESVRLARGAGIGGLIIETGRPFATADYLADTRIRHDPDVDAAVAGDGLVSMAGVPMRLGDELLGALFVANRYERTFTPAEIALLSSLADHVCILIANSRLFSNLQATAADLRTANELLRRRSVAVERASAAHEVLMPLALRRADVGELAAALTGILRGAVVVVGVDGTVLAQAVAEPGSDDLLRTPAAGWAQLVDEVAQVQPADPTARVEAVPAQDGDGAPTWVVPVRAGSETFAYLVFRGPAPLDEADVRTLERSAQTAALLLLMERQGAVLEQQLRGELLDELLAEREPEWASFRRRAQRSGMLDVDRPHAVLVVSADHVHRRQVLRAAADHAAARGGLAGEHAAGVVVLLPDVAPADASRTAAADLARALHGPVTVGAAGPAASARDVRVVWAAARRCHRLLLALGRAGEGATIEDLGVLGVILDGTTRAQVRRLLSQELGPLLAYDAENNALLLPTLLAYFASGRNPPAAARTLQVHPNTVYQRLERVDQVLGHRRWREPQGDLEMQLALQFHRILREIPLDELVGA